MTLSLLCGMPATAADLYSTISNVGYIDDAGADAYRSERCKLDLYLPQGKKDFPTVVFFHGGGLEGGEKFIPELLKEQGFAVVAPNYRLSPRAQHPAYIDDAAAAVAWTMRHIAE